MSKAPTAEQKVTVSFLIAGAVTCQNFAPHYQTHFLDKKGWLNEGKPDFYTCISGRHIFFESKCGGNTPLNTHQSKDACLKALRVQYNWRFKRDPGSMSHSQLSQALWDAGWHKDCLDHAWNHSLTKVLLIQKALGCDNYIVVFTEWPTEKAAANYKKKGLFFMHISQLQAYLTPAASI